MAVLFALVIAGALLAAPAAQAAPGKPSLLYVPPRSAPVYDGATQVRFGWRETTFDARATGRFYTLIADGPEAGHIETTVFASGDPTSDASAALALDDGVSYKIWVRAFEACSACGATWTDSDAVYTVVDLSGPQAPTMTIDGGASYTNRLDVSVRLRGAFGDDVKYGQISTYSTDFPCWDGLQEACPFPMSWSTYNADGTHGLTLPAGDGINHVYGRLRDSATRPMTTRSPGFSDGKPIGNPGASNLAFIVLDRTAPVAALANPAPTGVAGTAVALDASPSTDNLSGVDPNGFVWRFGDGSPDVTGSAKITHVYPGPGTYNGRVVVHDRSGHAGAPADTNVSSATFTVTVNPAPAGGGGAGTATPSPQTAATGTPTATTATGATGASGASSPAATVTPTLVPAATGAALPRTVTARTGALAATTIVGSAVAGKPIRLRLRLRRPATVTTRLLDSGGRVRATRRARHRAGSFNVTLPAVRAGRYKVVASAGRTRLTLPIAVRRG